MRAVLAIPPPLFYVASFVLGVVVERWAPVPDELRVAPGGAAWIGLTAAAGVLLVVGIVLGPLNAIRFLVRRTTLNPTKQANVFLTEGMYGLSRNPMYLGLFFIYVAVAILRGEPWPLATMVVPFLLLDRVVIPFEEKRMMERYGASYGAYRARVGRWVGVRRPR